MILYVLLPIIFLLYTSISIVPQQQAWIVERLGKFNRNLEPGLNFIIPFVDKIAYKHVLKEEAMDVNAQSAISNDNVSLKIDGVLYVKIFDPIAASYGVTNPYYAVIQLAQTTMRSEIGKLSLEKIFGERDSLNINIVNSINSAAKDWGIRCMRHEIKDIQPPSTVLQAMELQIAADRQKRAVILESEGFKQSKINNSEADKIEKVLSSEGVYTQKINYAKAEAETITMVAEATANSIKTIAASLESKHGTEAVKMKLAENYIEKFGELAKSTNSMIIPTNASDVSSFIAQALGIYKNVVDKNVTDKK